MTEAVKAKWHQKTSMIVVAFLCVGPLALPLVWMHPRYDLAKKILATLLMAVATYALWIFMKDSFGRLSNQYRDLKAAMGG